MKSTVMLAAAVVAVVLACGVDAQRPQTTRTYSVNCPTLVNCNQCAEVHYVGGNKAQPCHWDHIRSTCGYSKNEDHICNGNQLSPQTECDKCKRTADNKQKMAAAKSAAPQGGAPTAGGAGGAGAGAGAKPARNRCSFNDAGGVALKGICVFSQGQCRGNPVSNKNTGCTDPNKQWCCAAAIKGGKAAKADACSAHSGVAKCTTCLRTGKCAMHIRSGMCTSTRGNLARAGDANMITDETFCYKIREFHAKKKAATEAKRNAKKKL